MKQTCVHFVPKTIDHVSVRPSSSRAKTAPSRTQRRPSPAREQSHTRESRLLHPSIPNLKPSSNLRADRHAYLSFAQVPLDFGSCKFLTQFSASTSSRRGDTKTVASTTRANTLKRAKTIRQRARIPKNARTPTS